MREIKNIVSILFEHNTSQPIVLNMTSIKVLLKVHVEYDSTQYDIYQGATKYPTLSVWGRGGTDICLRGG